MIRPLREGEPIPYDLLLLADEERQAIDKYLPKAKLFVYSKNEETAAVIVLSMINESVIEIKNVAVKEMLQGQGIGTALIKFSCDYAFSNEFKEVWIGTGNASFDQQRLYQKLGFELFDVKWDFFINNYKNKIFENSIQLKDMLMFRFLLREEI